MERIILAYCHENIGLANQIDEKLRRSGIRFDHVSDHQDRLPGQFVAAIQATNAPVLLLITDNFLRRAGCMSFAQPMLQQLLRTNRVLPVIADGFRTNTETGRTELVETHFERVIHAITYMNYWQSVYLELRQKKDRATPENLDAIERELATVREISVEIGDFLNTLRNADYLSWENFSANQFDLFFRKFGVPELYQKYRQIAAADPVEKPADDHVEAPQNAPILPEISPKLVENSPEPPFFEEKNEHGTPAETPVLPEKTAGEIAENGPVLEKPADPESAHFREKKTGQSPLSIMEVPPMPIEHISPDDPIFESAGFDILANLDTDLDSSEALEAAKLRKKRLTAEPKTAPSEEIKKPRIKKKEDSNGLPIPPEEFVHLEKTDDSSEGIFEEKMPETAPVEIEMPRRLTPIPDAPTREQIEALVAEIVREEASKAGANTGLPEGTLAEMNEKQPVTEPGLDENPDVEKTVGAQPESADEPAPRRVSAMQLPHFQPVSASSTADDDIRITQTDTHFWLKKGDFEEARLQAEELAMKYPTQPEGWFLLGEISEAAGDFLAAKQFWEKTILIDDGFPGAHLRLAKLLDQRFKTQKKEAVQHYRSAAKIDPTDAASLYRAGVICFENLGKHEKARRFFQKTVNRQPENALAWYDLAHLEQHLGNLDEAAEAYGRAIELDPSLRTETEARVFVKKTFQLPDGFPEKNIGSGAVAIGEDPETEFSQKEAQPIENQVVAAENEPIFSEKKQVLTVLVTGATSGIGRATAEIFAKNGHRVLMTGRRAERLAELENDFSAHYKNELLTACFDIRDRQSVEHFIENLPENWREIDVLINNAGLAKGLDPIHESSFDHWEQMIDTNLKGLLYITRLVSPGMAQRGRGHIINIGSIAGKEVYPKGGVYNATKFAVDALTRAMRLDLVPHGVKVSSVSPGHVEETEFALVRFDGNAEKARIYDDFQPLSSQDVAETIYFIATRPAHVAIHDVVLTGAQQASATQVNRSGRG